MAFHESVELGPGKKSGTCWIREGNMADARMPGDPREKGGQRSLVVIVDRGILLEKEGSNLMDRSNSKIFNSFRPSFIFLHARLYTLYTRTDLAWSIEGFPFESNRILPRVLPIDRANSKIFHRELIKVVILILISSFTCAEKFCLNRVKNFVEED